MNTDNISDEMVAKATEVLNGVKTIGTSEENALTARRMLEAAFRDVSPLSQWWIGQMMTHDKMDLMFIKLRAAGAGLLFRNRGDGLNYEEVGGHHVDFRWAKDGHLTYFHVAKIPAPTDSPEVSS